MPADAENKGVAGGSDGGGAANNGAGGSDGGSGGGGGAGGDGAGSGAKGDASEGDGKGGDGGSGEWGEDGEGGEKKEDPKPGEKKGEAGKGKTGEADAPYKLEVPKELADFTSQEETDHFAAFAKKEGISLEHANKLAKYSAERSKVAIEASRSFLETQSKSWLNEIKKDEKLGGENFKATQANVRRALAHIGDAKAINGSATNMGISYWPPLVKLANALGELLAPDSGRLPGGKGGKGGEETHDQMLARLYGTG